MCSTSVDCGRLGRVHNCRSRARCPALPVTLASTRRTGQSGAVRGCLTGLVAAILCATLGVACGSSAPQTASNTAFCDSADKLLNAGSFASDGTGVVEALRALDISGLPGSDQEEISTAIDAVGANLASFNNGQAPDGWSTEPVATVAARLCGEDMSSFFAVP